MYTSSRPTSIIRALVLQAAAVCGVLAIGGCRSDDAVSGSNTPVSGTAAATTSTHATAGPGESASAASNHQVPSNQVASNQVASNRQVEEWLSALNAAVAADPAGFHTCDAGEACPLGAVTTFRTPTGAVACTALGIPAYGDFTCMLSGARFPMPSRPSSGSGDWEGAYIVQQPAGWVLGTFAESPRVADGSQQLRYGGKIVFSRLNSPRDAARLECGSFVHGVVCADHLTGRGFHASRQDFTPFTFNGTAP